MATKINPKRYRTEIPSEQMERKQGGGGDGDGIGITEIPSEQMERKQGGGGDGDGIGITETWLKKHTWLYKGATRHPFILSIRDGTVDLSSFKRWLGQDYLFVRNFVPFVANVLQKLSKASDDKDGDMEVVLGGITSLSDELTWFKNEASKWDVMLHGIAPQKTNQDYCRFLESLMSAEVDYTVAITAFWAIETVYQKSFAYCLEDGSKTPAELIDTCQRWGNEGFGQYCQTLQGIANRCLEKATDDIRRKAEATFIRVLECEVEFWNMSQGRD